MSDDEVDVKKIIEKLGKNPDDYQDSVDDFMLLKTIVETAKRNPENIGMAIFRAYELGKGTLYKEKS